MMVVPLRNYNLWKVRVHVLQDLHVCICDLSREKGTIQPNHQFLVLGLKIILIPYRLCI